VMAMGWVGLCFENLWWVGLGSPSDGLGWLGWVQKVDPCPPLIRITFQW